MIFYPMRVMKKRCDECGTITATRYPKRLIYNRPTLIDAFLKSLFCPHCHPELLDTVCHGCRLPWTLVKHHSDDQCGSCIVRLWRFERRHEALQSTVA